MELTTKIAFHAIELAGERHIAAIVAAEDVNVDVRHDVATSIVEATVGRLCAVYNALEALTEDDRALLVAGAERAKSQKS